MKRLCALVFLACFVNSLPAALIDVWRADDLNLNDNDIVGTWTYSAEFRATTITLELKLDGTFVQTVRYGSGRVQTHEGTWTLEGSRPQLQVLKPVFGEPPVSAARLRYSEKA